MNKWDLHFEEMYKNRLVIYNANDYTVWKGSDPRKSDRL